MSKILTIANQKGGVGKSTLAINLSVVAAQAGLDTILLDSDKQMSSANFRNIRPDDLPQFRCISIFTPTIHKDLKKQNFDLCVIDAGGRDTELMRSAILACEYLIIPIVPCQLDVWSTMETIKILDEARSLLPEERNIHAGLLLNQLVPHTLISESVGDNLLEICKNNDLKLFETKLYSRISYKESLSYGKAVVEMKEHKADKASNEMILLFEEVAKWMKN